MWIYCHDSFLVYSEDMIVGMPKDIGPALAESVGGDGYLRSNTYSPYGHHIRRFLLLYVFVNIAYIYNYTCTLLIVDGG